MNLVILGAVALGGIGMIAANKGGSADAALNLARDLVKGFEGFQPRKYKDSQGWSIGYGHFILPSEPYLLTATIDRTKGEELLTSDLAAAAASVNQVIKAKLSDKQRAALISFCYNVGSPAFKSSTLVSLVNAGKIRDAANQFDRWVYDTAGGKVTKVPALVLRRANEKALFLG